MHTSDREKALPHKHCHFTSSLHALLVQHLRRDFSIYGLVWFNIRNSWDAEKADKLVKIYRFYRAEEDNQ